MQLGAHAQLPRRKRKSLSRLAFLQYIGRHCRSATESRVLCKEPVEESGPLQSYPRGSRDPRVIASIQIFPQALLKFQTVRNFQELPQRAETHTILVKSIGCRFDLQDFRCKIARLGFMLRRETLGIIVMKTSLTKLSCLVIACALAACSTVSITTDYDPSVSFMKYKTYSLAPATRGQQLAPISESALRDSLRKALAARGINETSGSRADLTVVRHVFLQEKVSVQQYTEWGYGFGGGWPYAYGYYSMWPGAPITYVDVNQYTVGTLVLDLVDNRTKRLVYRGSGTAVVGGPQSNARKIEEAVTRIVAGIPSVPER